MQVSNSAQSRSISTHYVNGKKFGQANFERLWTLVSTSSTQLISFIALLTFNSISLYHIAEEGRM